MQRMNALRAASTPGLASSTTAHSCAGTPRRLAASRNSALRAPARPLYLVGGDHHLAPPPRAPPPRAADGLPGRRTGGDGDGDAAAVQQIPEPPHLREDPRALLRDFLILNHISYAFLVLIFVVLCIFINLSIKNKKMLLFYPKYRLANARRFVTTDNKFVFILLWVLPYFIFNFIFIAARLRYYLPIYPAVAISCVVLLNMIICNFSLKERSPNFRRIFFDNHCSYFCLISPLL